MSDNDCAALVLAYFGIPPGERQQHQDIDSRTEGRPITEKAMRSYRAIYASLSMEERLAAEARL